MLGVAMVASMRGFLLGMYERKVDSTISSIGNRFLAIACTANGNISALPFAYEMKDLGLFFLL